MGQAEQKEYEENTIGLLSGTSKAMEDYAHQSRGKSLKDSVNEIRTLNEKASAKSEAKSPVSSHP
jgi:hypothetical protein